MSQMEQARKRCPEIYGPKYCLVKFTEISKDNYHAICGLIIEKKCI